MFRKKDKDKLKELQRFAEFEKRQVDDMTEAEKYHLKIASEIDKQICIIQKSTKVNIPQLSWLHNYMRMKFGWYRLWHQNKYSNFVNLLLFISMSLSLLVGFAFSLYSGVLPAKAEFVIKQNTDMQFDQNDSPEFVIDSNGVMVSNEYKKGYNSLDIDSNRISAYVDEDSMNSSYKIEISTIDKNPGKYLLTLNDKYQYRPGLHKIVVNIQSNGNSQILEKEFYWGVLTINTNKSHYQLGEVGEININSYSDDGSELCGLPLTLEIIDPDGEKTTIHTLSDNKKIEIQNDCSKKKSDQANYKSLIELKKAGTFKINALLEAKKGILQSETEFVVQANPEIIINRMTPNFILSSEKNKNTLEIKSNIDYPGPVIEYVPVNFEIYPQDGMVVEKNNGQKKLMWEYSFKSGEKKIFSYKYSVPDVAPLHYKVGNAKIGPQVDSDGTIDKSNHVFRENRYWDISVRLSDKAKDQGTLVQNDESNTFKVKNEEKEIVDKRTETFKTFDKGDGQYRIGGSMGAVHYKKDPFDENEELKEINLSLKINERKKANGYDYYLDENGYQVQIWNSRRINGENINYIAKFIRADESISMAPAVLAWENKLGEVQEISKPNTGILPEIDNKEHIITWKDVFGTGIHFQYNISPEKFFKTVIIENYSNLLEPVIEKDGLKLTVVMSTSWTDVEANNGFAKDNENISLSTEYNFKARKAEKKDNPNQYSYKNSENCDLWSVQEPKAWDSSEEKKMFDINWSIEEIDKYSFIKLSSYYIDLDQSIITYPFYIDASISQEVVGIGTDDAYATSTTGAWSLTGTRNYLNQSTYARSNGFRWTSVPIPQGADITSANMGLYWYNATNDNPNVLIYGNNVDSATTFSSSSDSFALRDKTTAYAQWTESDVANWGSSVDFSSVVEEIVGRTGWSDGNDLALLTTYAGSGATIAYYFTYEMGSAYGARFNASYAANITISGTVYTAENKSTNIGADKTIALSIDGGAKSTVETTNGGAFSFTDIAGATAGKTITLFIDDETEESNLVTISNDEDITGLEMYTNKIVLKHENSGPLTNSNLDTANNCGDDEIHYLGTTNIDFADDFEVWIEAGKNYTPGGAVEAEDFEVRGSAATFNSAENDVTIHGLWTVDPAGIFVSSGTVTFDGSSGIQILNAGGNDANHDFQNLTKTSTSTLQLAGSYALEIVGTLSISSDSIFDLNGINLNSAPGIYSNAGTFKLQGGESCGAINANLNTGMVEYYGDSTYTPSCFTSSYNYPYSQLKISGNGIFTFGSNSLSNYINASANIEITNGTVNGALKAGSYIQSGGSMTISGDSTIYGDFSISSGLWDSLSTTYKLNFDATESDIEIVASGIIFDHSIYFINNSSVADRVINIGSGNLTFRTLYIRADGDSNLTIDASENNPNITITTGLNLNAGSGVGSEYVKLGDGIWEITTGSQLNIATDTITPNYSTFILDGGDININGNHLYNFEIKGSGTKNVRSNIYVDNNFHINADGDSDLTISMTSFTVSLIVLGDIDFIGVGNGLEIFSWDNGDTVSIGGNADFSGGQIVAAASSVMDFNASSGTQTLNTGGTSTENDFENITKSGGGELQITGNGLDFDGTLTIDDADCVVYINNQNISGDTNILVNNGTFKLNGDETVLITTWDSDSGTVEYVATSGSRPIKDYTYYDLKINGDGGTFTLPAIKTIHDLTLATGIFDLASYNLTVSNTFSNEATLRLTGDETVSLTNDADSGQVEYNGASGTRSIKNWIYYTIKINSTSGIYNLPATIDANGTINITSGTFVLNGYDLTVGLDWNNSATFTPGTNKVTFDGIATQTITVGGTGAGKTFYDLTVTNASVGGVIFADSCTLTGTFVDITASSKLTFNAGSTYSFANISLNGQASGTKIVMRSSSVNTQWFFNVSQVSPSATYVDVQDSDAMGGSEIIPSFCKNSGNNENWLFITSVYGTVYSSSDKSTNIGANKTIAYSINGGAKVTVETTSSGEFVLSGINISANNTLIIFIDDETEKGGLVTQVLNGEDDIENLEIYTSKFTIRHETSGPMTNNLLATADNCGDDDIKYSISLSDLTMDSGFGLKIDSGKIYTPGGNVTATSLDILSTSTFSPESNSLTLTGFGTPFVVSGTFNYSTSTVKYTGEGDTNIAATTYYNLETKPSGEAASSSSWIVSGAGSTAFNGTYTENGTYNTYPAYSLDSTHWLIFEPTGMLEDQWIITGQKGVGTIYYYCYTTDLPGSSWNVMSGDSPAPTVSAGFSPYTYTFASGTINIEGNYVNGDGTNAVNTTADTNDPTLNINGSFTNSADATFVASNSGSFSVASNFTNNSTATLTHSSGTLTLDGQGAQSITTNGDSLNNVTVTNASASGVTFADSLTLAGTFTATTASSIITFNALSTYAFANININGQAAGTHIVLQSSDPSNADLPSRQWYFNVSQTSPQASYVTVTDSDANGGNIINPVSCTDGGNNENWAFNTAPTNTSVTFTNPYSGSGNITVSDDTTEWNFRAVLSDDDGSADINYVELHFANNTDSSQPYDSLKYRWTEATDVFSEQADTQDAASITSTSSNSTANSNEWTLDFKIKFDSDFLTFNTNYAIELYTVDDFGADDTDNYSNIYQIVDLSLSIDVDNSILEFSSLLPGSVATDTTVTTVTCNHPNGYSLAVSDSISGGYSALLHTDMTTRIADYIGTISTPTIWSGTGLGITVYEANNKESKWGSGTTEGDSNNKYSGVPETATIIHTKTGSPTSSDMSKIGYKIVVPNTQKTGAYLGEITYTATGVLN